jgi:hypothetical protein
MDKRIRHFAFSDLSTLREHLRAAEARVDALSDSELDHAEADHQRALAAYLSQKEKSQSGRSYRKSSPVLSFVIIAASLFALLRLREGDGPGPLTPKGGSSSDSPVCEISVLQNDKKIVLESLASSAFVVQSLTKIYVFTSCKGPVTIESLERGIWVKKGFAVAEKGVLGDEYGYIDFRQYLGEELRLKVAHGTSEEFSLVTGP